MFEDIDINELRMTGAETCPRDIDHLLAACAGRDVFIRNLIGQFIGDTGGAPEELAQAATRLFCDTYHRAIAVNTLDAIWAIHMTVPGAGGGQTEAAVWAEFLQWYKRTGSKESCVINMARL